MDDVMARHRESCDRPRDLRGANAEPDNTPLAFVFGRIINELINHLLHGVQWCLPVSPVAIRDMAVEELHAQRSLLDGDHALIVCLTLGLWIHDAVNDLTLALIGIDVLRHEPASKSC